MYIFIQDIVMTPPRRLSYLPLSPCGLSINKDIYVAAYILLYQIDVIDLKYNNLSNMAFVMEKLRCNQNHSGRQKLSGAWKSAITSII